MPNALARRSFALIAGGLLVISRPGATCPAASAQSQGAVIGVVTDTSGAVLPGVTVIATGPALQVPQIEAVTNERGEYRLSPLPPGVFTITFELSGFQTVKRENLRLALGFTATVDQAMGLGTVQETVTVSGQSPLVDVTNPATSVDMSSESLEILPTNRDGLKAFMGTMPGVRTNLDVGASSMSDTVQFRSYGQSGQSWQMLEGIMFSTPNAGGANGSHVDFNALDSTRVQTVGSSAEMPRRGIMLDAVMKSGGNQFHGEFVAYGSSGALESTNCLRRVEGAGCHRDAGAPQAVGHQRQRRRPDHPEQAVVLRRGSANGIRPRNFRRLLHRRHADAQSAPAAVLVGKAVVSDESVAQIRRVLPRREGARTPGRQPVRAGRVAGSVRRPAGNVGRQLAGGARQFAWSRRCRAARSTRRRGISPSRAYENIRAGNPDTPSVHKIPTLDTFTSYADR